MFLAEQPATGSLIGSFGRLGLKQEKWRTPKRSFLTTNAFTNTTKPSRLAWKWGRAEESPGSWQQIIWSTVFKRNILFIAYVNNRYSGRAPVHRRLEMNMDKFDQKVGALRRRVAELRQRNSDNWTTGADWSLQGTPAS